MIGMIGSFTMGEVQCFIVLYSNKKNNSESSEGIVEHSKFQSQYKRLKYCGETIIK